MEKIISLIEKYSHYLQPIHYFIILAAVLLITPFVYRFIKSFYKDRIEASDHLIKIKSEIIDSQDQKMKIINGEIKSLKSDRDKKIKNFRDIAKLLKSITEKQMKLSRLNDLTLKHVSTRANLLLALAKVIYSHLAFISTVKSMLAVYMSMNIKEKYSEAPDGLELLDQIQVIEEKINEWVAAFDETDFDSLIMEPNLLAKVSTKNIDLEIEKIDPLILSMQDYIDKCNLPHFS